MEVRLIVAPRDPSSKPKYSRTLIEGGSYKHHSISRLVFATFCSLNYFRFATFCSPPKNDQ